MCWGDGSASREFLYVDDAAEGIVLATERYNGAEPVNLGSGREITIKELTEQIAELCGFSSIYSFSRAFRTSFGVSPLAYRHGGRAAPVQRQRKRRRRSMRE